jgi:hypothetical protein
MDFQKSIIDILFFLALALLVFATAFFLLKRFFDGQYRLKLLEAKLQTQKDIVPLRLQAYERLTVLLERISPNNLIGRIYQPGLTVRELHLELLSNIRSEFDHNISQQIYVSQDVWNHVRNTREEIVKVINAAGSSIDPNAKCAELSKIIFENLMKENNDPSQKAIDFIKKEVNQLY